MFAKGRNKIWKGVKKEGKNKERKKRKEEGRILI